MSWWSKRLNTTARRAQLWGGGWWRDSSFHSWDSNTLLCKCGLGNEAAGITGGWCEQRWHFLQLRICPCEFTLWIQMNQH